jgi:hypothetical protein
MAWHKVKGEGVGWLGINENVGRTILGDSG